ncbi:MAG: DUF262 domain-containing protein [Treponema sp.]|nr:DUF262 domain-containing protein [Treponema sp.]
MAMENDWKLEEFSIQKMHEMIDIEKIIEIPSYQRGIVWSQSQINDLLDSIKRGLPFGSILLFKRPDGHYLIIDGLQRTSSIYKFVNEPGKFFEESDINKKDILNLITKFNISGNKEELYSDISSELINWVKSNKTMKEVKDLQYAEFGYILSNKYSILKGKEFEIGKLVSPMLKNFKDICDNILSKKIPAIVMTGTDDNLPDVFDRINSKGTTLSKYDIYSASWGDEKYYIDESLPKEILEANRDRYDNMLYGQLQLADYDSVDFIKTRELKLFELAFGFGKYISNTWPQLFGESSDPKKMCGIGFNLINACLCNPNNKLKAMKSIFNDKIGQENITIFISKIIECINEVDKTIGAINKFKGNSQKNNAFKPKHTDFQILSIILTIFINKYVIFERDTYGEIKNFFYTFDKENPAWKNLKPVFDKNVIRIYLMEIVNGRWSGTGDKKLDLIIENPQYYMRVVSEKEFRDTIESWYNGLNSERLELSRVSNPKEPELILMAAIYIHTFSAKQNLDDSFYDIEHLATKKLMKTKLEKYNGDLRLPISSFGNLCYLPSILNRQKKEKTIYQDKNYRNCVRLEEVEEKYTFTQEKDLAFLDEDLTADAFKKKYFEFINLRFTRMLDKLVGFYF